MHVAKSYLKADPRATSLAISELNQEKNEESRRVIRAANAKRCGVKSVTGGWKTAYEGWKANRKYLCAVHLDSERLTEWGVHGMHL